MIRVDFEGASLNTGWIGLQVFFFSMKKSPKKLHFADLLPFAPKKTMLTGFICRPSFIIPKNRAMW